MINVFLNKKKILRCKNTTMAFLYDELINVIDQKSVQLNPNQEKLIQSFDTAGYGIDFDLCTYLKQNDDFQLIIIILKDAISLYLNRFPSLDEQTVKDLWTFYDEIVQFAKSN
jgi:hypothetical protein